jgi:iron complex transport system ATP-binding protein
MKFGSNYRHRRRVPVGQSSMSPGDVSLKVEGLAVHFENSVGLHDVSVCIPTAQLTAIVGPPGSGKTTLLRALSCELPWASGSLVIRSSSSSLGPPKKWDCSLCICPSHRPESCPFNPTVNGLEHLGEALHLLGLEHLMNRAYESLSERDRRRVELASALVPLLSRSENEVCHLWLDDPVCGLAELHQHKLLRWLADSSRARQTTVFTTTDHALARVYAEHVILLSRGAVISEGTPRAALSAKKLTEAFADQWLLTAR